MPSITDSPEHVSPSVSAAVLLAARPHLKRYKLPCPTAAAILAATGAGRTRSYELASELTEALPGLERPVGRPKSEPPPAPPEGSISSLQSEVIGFMMAHPGCVSGVKRRRYSDQFRSFVVELRPRYASLPLSVFAEAIQIPSGTIEEWLRKAEAAQSGAEAERAGADDSAEHHSLRIQTIINAWRGWDGSLSQFCKHINDELEIPYGRTLVTNILIVCGLWTPKQRPKRSPDELAQRGSFETFFPGAQWIGDGHEISVELNGERFTFNLELIVDADSGALVGGYVSDEEDANAVIQAFRDGVTAVGDAPLAVLLDNRSSNHTEQVDQAFQETLRIRATIRRPQNKAHVEGAFGLFEQAAPPLRIWASDLRQLAARLVELIVQTWARTLNHKPRRDRDDRSRVQLYEQRAPSEEQIQHARDALEERQRKQEKAYETQRSRKNLVTRELLVESFKDLGLIDPDGNVQRAIAGYPLDDIIEGIATFKAKRATGSLPDGVDGRYLLGIVRNLHHENRQMHLADELLRLRLKARDLFFEPLRRVRAHLIETSAESATLFDRFLDRAIRAERQTERWFWLRSVAHLLCEERPPPERLDLLRRATTRIRTAFRIPPLARDQAIRYLTRKALPVE